MQTFTLSFNRFMKALMTPVLAGPRRCRVELDGVRVKVVMGLCGWAFATKVPRSSITRVERARGPVLGWGAHGWRGRWLINGSSRGLVRLTVEPPARGRCLFVPLKVRQLTLSLDQPDEFITASS